MLTRKTVVYLRPELEAGLDRSFKFGKSNYWHVRPVTPTYPEGRVVVDAPAIGALVDSTIIALPVVLFLTGLICRVAAANQKKEDKKLEISQITCVTVIENWVANTLSSNCRPAFRWCRIRLRLRRRNATKVSGRGGTYRCLLHRGIVVPTISQY